MKVWRKRKRRERSLYRFNDIQSQSLLNNEVFQNPQYLNHVKEVSMILKIDEKIVDDVLKSYFLTVFKLLNKVYTKLTKINLYGFFSFYVKPGNRI